MLRSKLGVPLQGCALVPAIEAVDLTLLKHLVFWLFAGTGIWLALANRTIVLFSTSPLSFQIEAPLYLLLFAALFIGMGFGSFAAWQAGLRRKNRDGTKSPLPPPKEETNNGLERTLIEADIVQEHKVLR